MADNYPRSLLGEGGHDKEGSRGSSRLGSQDIRRSRQYAEIQANPLPELVVDQGSAPEPVNVESNGSSGNTRWDIQPDLGDQRSAVVSNAPRSRKWKAWLPSTKGWVYIAIAVLVSVGCVVGAIEGVRASSKSSAASNSSSSTSGGAVSSSHASRTAGTTAAPTGSSAPPSGACEPSVYIAKVNWMGISGASGDWDVEYPEAADAAGCCNACYMDTAKGCDGWSFIPSASGSTIAACAVIAGWPGTKNDTTCPSGYTTVQFSQDGNNASHVGGAGPCATIAK